MGYQIEAFLNDGKPSLKIYDSKRELLYLSWTYHETPDEHQLPQAIHELFRDLLLLSCKQDIHNIQQFNLTPRQSDNKIRQTVLLF
ncbi:hypothetical protein [Aliikangiella maris]|uniref:Uncharacterized protein n=2 Tax=Aliikangiella maris TaxID=3162458 RepID=A0ABV3MUX4_9GAMM